MKDIKCPKCSCESVFIQKKGNQTGLYCYDCGAWIKWATKEEIRLCEYNEQVKLTLKDSNEKKGIQCAACGYTSHYEDWILGRIKKVLGVSLFDKEGIIVSCPKCGTIKFLNEDNAHFRLERG